MTPFQHVLDEHGPGLYRHLVGTLGPHDGADCYQETVIAALGAWPPAHEGNVRAWMFTIAHRKAIDLGRAASRRALPVEHVPERPGPPAPSVSGVADHDGDVWTALRSLPEKQKLAVALRHGEDWGYADIAAVLDCTEAAARQSVTAGLAKLKELLRT